MKKIFETLVGLCIWIAIGWGVYAFFIKGDTEAKDADLIATLAEFRENSQEHRHAIIKRLAGDSQDDLPHFINCMGDFAANKSPDLIVQKVFGWCETERENNRERFESHFNELDAEDMSSEAAVICQTFVNRQLISPSTADHPTMDRKIWSHGKWRYTIKSYVDSQNAFGATIRSNYTCEIKFNNTGNWANDDNWTLISLEAQ